MNELPIVMLDEQKDEPPVTLDSVLKYLAAFVAGIGFTAACIVAWIYWGAR